MQMRKDEFRNDDEKDVWQQGYIASVEGLTDLMGRGLNHFRQEGARLIPEPTEPDLFVEEAYRLWTIKQQGQQGK